MTLKKQKHVHNILEHKMYRYALACKDAAIADIIEDVFFKNKVSRDISQTNTSLLLETISPFQLQCKLQKSKNKSNA